MGKIMDDEERNKMSCAAYRGLRWELSVKRHAPCNTYGRALLRYLNQCLRCAIGGIGALGCVINQLCMYARG